MEYLLLIITVSLGTFLGIKVATNQKTEDLTCDELKMALRYISIEGWGNDFESYEKLVIYVNEANENIDEFELNF
jgi:hypothetical protein